MEEISETHRNKRKKWKAMKLKHDLQGKSKLKEQPLKTIGARKVTSG